ncbi:MAG TPA: hypothetical protein VGC79_09020, partial [Polyangiaceae bacterium]
MRSASAVQLSSLFGSIGLHVGVLLVLLLSARRPAPALASVPRERADAWLGASTVEVDALATPEATPNIENAASSPESDSTPGAAASEPAAEAVATPRAVPAERQPDAEPAPKPKPTRPRPRRPAKPSTAIAVAPT